MKVDLESMKYESTSSLEIKSEYFYDFKGIQVANQRDELLFVLRTSDDGKTTELTSINLADNTAVAYQHKLPFHLYYITHLGTSSFAVLALDIDHQLQAYTFSFESIKSIFN